MELYAGAALTGMGYLLNKQRDILKNATVNAKVDPRERPTQENLVASDYWKYVRQDEQQRADLMASASRDPMQTGIVPKPAYASMFASPLQSSQNPSGSQGQAQSFMSLSGDEIPMEQFTHNNMQPFFRGSVRQNVSANANETLLESHTGRGSLLMNKQEVENFFEPTPGYTNMCGMQSTSDHMLNHIEVPVARRNDFPIDQVRVGPGLNQGYTSAAIGGYQQANTVDIVRRGLKTINELRPGNKPKTVMEGRVQGPSKGTTQRGWTGQVAKNRVDTWYEQKPDQWLKSRAAITGERQRPVVDMKPTARVEQHVEYSGVAAGVASKPGMGVNDDYGKESILVYDNERMTTQTRTVVSNITTVVKAAIAPLLDVLRHNTKEYTVDASRSYGNMHAQQPSRPTMIDPVDGIMRTTIKETTIHDTSIGNLTGAAQGHAENPADMKPTVRETLPVEETTRNLAGRTYKVVVYNPDEVARKTIRETTECAVNELGFVGGAVSEGTGAYSVIDVQVPLTQKQFVSDYEYQGNADSQSDFRPMSDLAAQNMEVDPTREVLNIAAGYTPNGSGEFASLDPANVDLESKKMVVDDMAARTVGNVSRVYQTTTKAMDRCELTQDKDSLNALENRLDPSILSSLKDNPYNLNVNPIA
jgi:hypothetical protein